MAESSSSPDSASPAVDATGSVRVGRVHARRLRDIWRSAGWPCQDLVEIELLVAGLVERVRAEGGHETLRVTDAGVALLAGTLAGNRAARSDHEALVGQVARAMQRAGRLVWTGLSLRARVAEGDAARQTGVAVPIGLIDGDAPHPPQASPAPGQWVVAMPDVFSIRHTTVEAYLEPVVHEIKVRRADLLADLKRPAKREAYLDLGGECWYVLGRDARGRPIGSPDEIPAECGVMLVEAGGLVVARSAPRRPIERLPFPIWMELARRTPWPVDESPQALLGGMDGPADRDGG